MEFSAYMHYIHKCDENEFICHFFTATMFRISVVLCCPPMGFISTAFHQFTGSHNTFCTPITLWLHVK